MSWVSGDLPSTDWAASEKAKRENHIIFLNIMVINIYVFNSKHILRRFGSDQGFILEDAHVFLVCNIQELADIVHIGFSHCLAIVFLYQEA